MPNDFSEKILVAHFAAVQARNTEAWLATLAEDAVSFDPVDSSPCQGKDSLRQLFQKEVCDAFESIQMTLDNLFVVGQHAAAKWTFQGTRKDGRKIRQEGINTFELTEQGLVKSVKSYYGSE